MKRMVWIVPVLLGTAGTVVAQEEGGPSPDSVAIVEMETRYIQPPAPIPAYFARDPNYVRLDAPDDFA